MNIPDYYAILGIPRFTNDSEIIKKAYTSQIKFFHPDANNVPPIIAEEKTRQLIAAYDVLRDSKSKYYYDYTLRLQLDTENSSHFDRPQTPPSDKSRPNPTQQKKAGTSAAKTFITIFVVLLFFVFPILNSSSSSNNFTHSHRPPISNSSSSPSSSSKSSSSSSKFSSSLSPVYAYTGMEFKTSSEEGVAPFEIIVSSNSNYYIYLKDIKNNGLNDLSFYVSKGDNIEKLVPLGRYELYYACGETWYGEKDKFGEDTYYYKGDGYLDFTEGLEDDGYYYYYGHTIELILQSNGNYDSDYINPASFPD